MSKEDLEREALEKAKNVPVEFEEKEGNNEDTPTDDDRELSNDNESEGSENNEEEEEEKNEEIDVELEETKYNLALVFTDNTGADLDSIKRAFLEYLEDAEFGFVSIELSKVE